MSKALNKLIINDNNNTSPPVIFYLDDILAKAKSFDEHLMVLREIFIILV
jgi:hypothetical protein